MLVAVGPDGDAHADSARAVDDRGVRAGTVSNVGCGFDVLGFALEAPGDVVIVEASERPGVEIAAIEGDGGRLPRDPRRNTAGVAVHALLDAARRRARHPGVDPQRPAAGERHRQQRRQRRCRRRRGQRAARPAGAARASCSSARWRGRWSPAGPRIPTMSAPSLYGGFVLARTVRSARRRPAAGARGAVVRARCIRTSKWKPGPRGRCSATPFRCATRVRQWGNIGALVAGLFRERSGARSGARSRITSPSPVARISCPALPPSSAPRSRPARSAAACRGRGRRCLPSAPAASCAEASGAAMRAAFAHASDVDADLWISAVAPARRPAGVDCNGDVTIDAVHQHSRQLSAGVVPNRALRRPGARRRTVRSRCAARARDARPDRRKPRRTRRRDRRATSSAATCRGRRSIG